MTTLLSDGTFRSSSMREHPLIPRNAKPHIYKREGDWYYLAHVWCPNSRVKDAACFVARLNQNLENSK